MRDDDTDEQSGENSVGASHYSDSNVEFGDYAVVGTGIQVVLGGRPITHPGE
ncbi:MAG: hypothetical protein AAGK00_13995 [Pseudomonadota bacterium]